MILALWIRRGWRCGCAAAFATACVSGNGAAAETPTPDPVVAPSAVAAVYRPPEDPRELLAIDDSIRRYFAQHVAPSGTDYERLCALMGAILLPDGLNFAYDAHGTYDPRETFRRRSGNCASYAFLVTAVARELGFDASFQTIERASRWSRVGDLLVVVQHLDVRVESGNRVYVVDLDPSIVPRRDSDAMNVIPDKRAFAQFYCNIGFERVVSGDMAEALRYMELATQVDPDCAGAWANRGTLLGRLGDLAAAKVCFERSLVADARGELALDGLVSVLRRLGAPDDLRRADQLERRARAIRERNPYYHQRLATRAQERGELADAEKRLRRAIALKSDEPEFYVQWMAVLRALDRSADAERVAAKLAKLRARLASESVHVVPER